MEILQFSGGKDSLACLYMLEPKWDNLTVVWGNSGAAYPETLELMEKIKKLVRFVEVKADQPSFIENVGYPSDILSIRSTPLGHVVHGTNGRRFTDYLSCCNANLWRPVDQRCKELGATVIYRGQRKQDEKKGPIMNGQVVDGVKYVFPLYEWTTDQVKWFLGDRIPSYYLAEKSSHDCWSCTAYLEDNWERIKNLPNEKREHVMNVLMDMRDVIKRDMNELDGVINGCLQ